jgi:hypothetical protein
MMLSELVDRPLDSKCSLGLEEADDDDDEVDVLCAGTWAPCDSRLSSRFLRLCRYLRCAWRFWIFRRSAAWKSLAHSSAGSIGALWPLLRDRPAGVHCGELPIFSAVRADC